VREDGRRVGEEEWQEKVYNREEWKKLLRTARNRRILHMPMEWMNEIKMSKRPVGYRISHIILTQIHKLNKHITIIVNMLRKCH
jgi:hypothetical protein